MISLSTAMLDAMTAQLASAFNGGFIRIFDGSRPARTDMAETGTLLGIVSANGAAGAGLSFQAGGNAIYVTPYQRMAFRGLAAGEATWFRLVGPADSGGASTTDPRIDGDIGTFDAPGDMAWNTTSVLLGGSYTLDAFSYYIHPMGPTP